jgi:hypothetical protein
MQGGLLLYFLSTQCATVLKFCFIRQGDVVAGRPYGPMEHNTGTDSEYVRHATQMLRRNLKCDDLSFLLVRVAGLDTLRRHAITRDILPTADSDAAHPFPPYVHELPQPELPPKSAETLHMR